MGTFTPIQVGQELDGYPAVSHNFFGESIEELQAFTNAPHADTTPPPNNEIAVFNDTGEDINTMFPVLRLYEAAYKPADEILALSAGVHMLGKKPDTSTVTDLKFAILQGPAQEDQIVPAIYNGPSWVKLDVTDDSLDHAEPIDGDATKLKASSSGVVILWKETGVGEKWAIVLLGAAGATTTRDATAMIVATVPAATLDGANKTSTPGKLADGAYLLDYKRDANGDHEQPPVDMEAKQEDDPTFVQTDPPTPPSQIPQVDAVRDVINHSKTEIRASEAEPIQVPGRLRKIGDVELFEIAANFDLRSLPGLEVDDEIVVDELIPYKPADTVAFELAGEKCE